MGFRLTHDVVRLLLNYDPATGVLTHKPRPRKYFRRRQDWLGWNYRYVGRPAFNTPHNMGYYCGSMLGHYMLAHTVIWFWMTGRWPTFEIDHDDHDGRNNRWENLFDRSHRDNMRNRKLSVNNTTGVNGVYFSSGGFQAQMEIDRKCIDLGWYRTLKQAAAARRAADNKRGFHAKHGR